MTTWGLTQERILREANDIRFTRVLITLISAPFFAVGFLLMCLWLVVLLVWQAGWVGASVARASLNRSRSERI